MNTPSKPATEAAEAINNAWSWDISLDRVAEIIDQSINLPEIISSLDKMTSWANTLQRANDLSPNGPCANDVREAAAILAKLKSK